MLYTDYWPEGDDMDIKGLGSAVGDARKAINRVRAATVDVSQAAAAFVADAENVTAQIKRHHDDLLFEVSTLGNSNGGEESSPPQKLGEPSAKEGETFPAGVDAGKAAAGQ